MAIARLIQQTLETQRDKVALTTASSSLTFDDLQEQFDLWHRFLDDLEVGVGERVAVILDNTPDLVAIHGGQLLCGRITVPLNPRQTIAEMARIFADARPALIVTSRAARPRVDEALEQAGYHSHVLEEHLIRSSFSSARRSPAGTPVEITDDMPAMIVYTSGTTGLPKGAVLNQGNLGAAALSLHQAWEFSPDDHLLLTLPLFHVHGLGIGIHGMLVSGFSVTLKQTFLSREVLNDLQSRDSGFTLFFGVPTYYHRLLQDAETADSLDHLRLCVSGSAPLSADMHREFEDTFGIRILERYGMSETLMNISNPVHGERHPGCIGQPLPGVQVRLVDRDGKDVSAGEEGEIWLKGDNVFSGYWKNPEATAAAFHEDWFATGDLARFRPELQSYQITGRAKELIISGGYNVHPQEVENALHPVMGGAEFAVAGSADSEFGEIVTAFVVQGSRTLTLEEVRAHCQDRLSAYKIPKRLVFVDEIPRNALGKIQRSRLSPENP